MSAQRIGRREIRLSVGKTVFEFVMGALTTVELAMCGVFSFVATIVREWLVLKP